MDNKNKKIKLGKREIGWIIVGILVVATYVLLQNIGKVSAFLGGMLSIASPFFWGVGLAYLLSLLMCRIERTLLKKITSAKWKRAIALTLTLIITLAAFTGLFFAIIPQLFKSITTLVSSVSGYFDNSEESLVDWATRIGIPSPLVQSLLNNWEDLVNNIVTWVRDSIPEIINASVRVGSGIVNSIIAIFVAVYVLIDLEQLMRQIKRITLAIFGEKHYHTLDMVRVRAHRAFGGFLVGQSIDSLMVGVICFIFMMIFKWDYALLISVIIGVTNVIPTFGPFIGAIPSIFILLIIDPMSALGFSIFILVLQQIDGNLVAPAILGDKLGLSALWILFAVVLFGSIWGLPGMVIGVPLFSVIYDLTRDFISDRLRKKSIDPETIISEIDSAKDLGDISE